MTDARRIQHFYAQFQAILGFYVTNTCNLECRHCGTGSGPKVRTALAIDDALAASVTDAIRHGRVRALHVSGGEPFLRLRDLARLSEIAAKEGVPLAVNTNGYWAPTRERGCEILAKLPGITHLVLSTDTYHAEFLPVRRLITAAQAALDGARLVDICIVTPFARRDAFAEVVDLLLEEAGLRDRIRPHLAALGPTGRDTALDDDDLAPWQDSPPTGPCHLLNRPTVLEDRSVLACCNTPMARACTESPLTLGNAGETPLHDILEDAARDPLLRALRILGPAFLLELLGAEGRQVLRSRYRQGDICTLCTDIMGSAHMVALLRERLPAHAMARVLDAAFQLQCINENGPDRSGPFCSSVEAV